MISVMFVIVPIFTILVFVFVFAMIISPKFKGKMMSRQIKANRYMVEESKDDIKYISDNMAYATKDGLKTTTRAIKEGLIEDTIYCKYCGSQIDVDSKYCKKCGEEQ